MRPFFKYNYVCSSFVILAALQRGPPVTTAGVAPYSPWAVLVTWNQPNGVSLNDIWKYRLDFQTFSVEVPATHSLMFHSQDTNIYPGSEWKSTFFFRGGNSTNCFFSNLSPRFRCVTSPKYPGLNSYLGFLFWHLWMTTSSPRAREHLR